MKRAVPIVLLALLGALVVYLVGGNGGAPPEVPGANEPPTTKASNVVVDATPVAGGPAATDAAARREVTTPAAHDEAELDGEYLAALAGFRGRVLDAEGAPVVDKLVKLYNFSAESVFPPGLDVFVEEVTAEPRIDAGEARTDSEGRFEILRVAPRAAFLLHAAIDHDAPAWRIVQDSPAPGEIVDLGDIVLQNLGVLIGEVVGPDGKPVEGATVRAVDLPGSVLGFVPLERLDPHGALIITEDGGHVVTAPPWFADRWAQLPVATTTTGADGTFRLAGVFPGGNVVAVTKPGLLSNVRPRVVVEPGEEKDLGKLRLPDGEFAYGKVVDDDGEPITGAEVLVASQSPAAPVHFASYADPTDDEGTFELGGLPPRGALVAVRRVAGEPWQIVGPQPVTQDFVVTLPSHHDLTLRITRPGGEAVTDPRLQVLRGDLDNGAVELAMWGVTRPIALDDRLEKTEDGATRIREIPSGSYAVLISADGCATTGIQVELTDDAERTVELESRVAFDVRVLGPDGEPVRHADVYVEARGPRPRLPDMPVHAGRTAKDGELAVEDVRADQVRVAAMHPAYGSVSGELTLPAGAPLELRFAAPATVEGVLTDGGAVPEPGKWTVLAMFRGGDFDAMPRMDVPDAEGRFRIAALTPGNYRIVAIPTLDVVTSPGKLMEFVMAMEFSGDTNGPRVELAPGEVEQVAFDASQREEVTGPSARVTGFATIDGRPAQGYLIRGWGGGRRLSAEIDAAGRFDLGLVPVGHTWLSLHERPTIDTFGPRMDDDLWQRNVEIEDGKDVDLVIEVETSSVAGEVFLPDGRPAVAAQVRGHGGIPDPDGKNFQSAGFSAITDERGRFEAKGIRAATFEVHAEFEGHRGSVSDVVAAPGAGAVGVRIELHRTYKVRGTLDMSIFGEERPRWVWINLQRNEAGGTTWSEGANIDREGRFEVENVEPGTYEVMVHCHDENDRFDDPFVDDNPIVVRDRDVEVTVRARPMAIPETAPQQR